MFSLFPFIFIFINLSIGLPLSPTEDLSQYYPRIVGGEEAARDAAPHMAALVISDVIKMLVCGASIISPKHLLTAAHCIEGFVVWGELLQTFHAIVATNDWFNKGTAVRIADFHIHPQWDPHTIKNDAGILRLEEKLALGDRVAVIPLEFNWVGGDEEGYVAGWGRLQAWGITPFKLQILFVRTMSPDRCREELLGSPVWGASPPTLRADVEVCTFHSAGHGMCHGDSGSALVLPPGRQAGIVSWGYPCARGLPDVYTRISGIREFIQNIITFDK